MAAFAFLFLGLICAIISRILLFTAAFKVGAGWALGVLLPFGPTFFRLSYPEEARGSRMFRFATLPCLLLYFVLGPRPSAVSSRHDLTFKPVPAVRYAMEKISGKPRSPGPQVQLTPSPEERRIANSREFERLRAWNEALRLKKRDLLHSDTAGNLAYISELGQYKAA